MSNFEMDSRSVIWDAMNTLDMKHAKQEAQVTTLGFILEGIESNSIATKKGEDTNMSCRFASLYPTYSQMLFFILQELQDFTKELHGSVEDLCNIAARMKKEPLHGHPSTSAV